MVMLNKEMELHRTEKKELQKKKLDEIKMRLDEKILIEFHCYKKNVHI